MDTIKEYGQTVISIGDNTKICVVTIIGEIEGHDVLSGATKTTKYEHMIPRLVLMDNDNDIAGILFILNTIGGDVECGLALAELIASLKKPTVSIVIGGSHSIGIPLAVATDYSFIVPSATMLVHPVRMNGLVLAAPQTYCQFHQMQERIISFVSSHSKIDEKSFVDKMYSKDMMAKDLGTILVGREAVNIGLIQEVGGLNDAVKKLVKMIDGKDDSTGIL